LVLEDRWALVEAFLRERGLVRQHLDSYNDFIDYGLQRVIDDVGGIELDIEGVHVEFGKISVGEPWFREADGSYSRAPNVTPNIARMRNMSYLAPLYLEMSIVSGGQRHPPQKVMIGEIPVMLKSKICVLHGKSEEELVEMGEDPMDPGGYFIINGSERVIVIQDDLATNSILVERDERLGVEVAKVFSSRRGFRALVVVERKKDGLIRVSFPAVPGQLPLVVVMKALGLVKDKDIVEAVSDDPEIVRELFENLREGIEVKTEKDALDVIGKRVAIGQVKSYRLQRAQEVLDKYLLPHIGTSPEDRLAKAYFLGSMVERVIELSLGRRGVDDKDHYGNKRLKLSGEMLENIFRVALANLIKDIKYQLERSYARGRELNLRTAARADLLTEHIRHTLATGNWPGGRTGVSQLLDRTNYISTLSHLRRIISPLSRSQPHFEARDLHPTHWGKICPSETPEGPNCGLVKNLALTAEISTGADEGEVERGLYRIGVTPIRKGGERSGRAAVFLNGRVIGTTTDGEKLAQEIRERRRRGEFSDQVNVRFKKDTNEVTVWCDPGRVRRPLIVVKDGKPLVTDQHLEMLKSGRMSWGELVREGVVEYLDADEEENTYVAINPEELTPEHTHLELHPLAMLGVGASLIPYPEHNQSPRNTYGANMAKQALGVFSVGMHTRTDTHAYFLHYPQRPLVGTRVVDLVGLRKRPCGQNLVVAIACYGGYNMEDALIVNRDSIDRGLGRSTSFTIYEAEEGRYSGGQRDKFEVPPEEVRGFSDPTHYQNLGEDGIVEPECRLAADDVVIGRTSPPRFFEETDEFGVRTEAGRRESSVRIKAGEEGIADMVYLVMTAEGYRSARVRVRSLRIPELGDKFASRHGQKGVVGMVMDGADMPFTESGIVPDLIINPHAIPSRMSIGQLLEMVAGKAGALEGREVDGTAFEGEPEEAIRKALLKHGFSPVGKEVMYNGMTGEMIPAEIFIGVCYYQRLHHMAVDKVHVRSRGPVQVLTHQPTEGRAREGGLRFGEMERDCLIGYGAARLLRDRLLESSDKFDALICGKCGHFSVYDRKRNRIYCPFCEEESEIYSVEMPYAFKLLLDELRSLCLDTRIKLREKA